MANKIGGLWGFALATGALVSAAAGCGESFVAGTSNGGAGGAGANTASMAGGAGAERITGERVGARYLPTLGIRPALGRNFLPDEDRTPDGPRVAMLAHDFWARRYGADSSVLGRSIVLNGAPHTIVGVLPPNFRGLTGQADLWTPMMAQPVTTAFLGEMPRIASRITPSTAYSVRMSPTHNRSPCRSPITKSPRLRRSILALTLIPSRVWSVKE